MRNLSCKLVVSSCAFVLFPVCPPQSWQNLIVIIFMLYKKKIKRKKFWYYLWVTNKYLRGCLTWNGQHSSKNLSKQWNFPLAHFHFRGKTFNLRVNHKRRNEIIFNAEMKRLESWKSGIAQNHSFNHNSFLLSNAKLIKVPNLCRTRMTLSSTFGFTLMINFSWVVTEETFLINFLELSFDVSFKNIAKCL